jgi:hypothetical protein
MTTQDSSALDETEAERLASMIRPAWEVDEDDSVDAGPEAAIPATAKSADSEASTIAAKLATDPGSPPARDTVIDGSPTIGVGPTDPGPPPEAPAAGAPKKLIDPAPQPAGPTKLGMGDDIAEGLAQVDSGRAKSAAKATMQGVAPPSQPPPAPSSPPPSEEVTEALAVSPSLRNMRRTDVIEAPPVKAKPAGASRPLTPVKPQAASFSKADDPIEIPVRKGSNATLIIVGLVAAVAAIAGGVMLLGGDDSKPEAKQPAAATEAKPTTTATAKPIVTAAETAAPLPTASAAPTASASAGPSATATATASATATAVAKVDPPKPEVTQKPPPPKPTATGGGKPPPKGGGGIIRDTPF